MIVLLFKNAVCYWILVQCNMSACTHIQMQYLSMAVQMNDIKSQARGFSTMAGLYEETGQMRKAHEYYQKVSRQADYYLYS